MPDPESAAEMGKVLESVEEISVDGKFPNGASMVRRLRGEPPVVVELEKPSDGWNDYIGGRGHRYTNLFGQTGGLTNFFVSGPLHDARRRLPSSLASDTQFYVVDTARGVYSGEQAVASYVYEQAGGDASGRPLRRVQVSVLFPNEQADKSLDILRRDPDAIEDFYHGTAEGLESHVTRIQADRLTVIDGREIPEADKKLLLDSGSSYDGANMLTALELQGRIPRLDYKQDVHGIVPSKAAASTGNEIVPQIDVTKGQVLYTATMSRIRDKQTK